MCLKEQNQRYALVGDSEILYIASLSSIIRSAKT